MPVAEKPSSNMMPIQLSTIEIGVIPIMLLS